ncbi:hypothetical protein [Paracraurococcus ruber]|uniref:DUF4129 domain-containing protein n=1 Tax=Paracraurococcus ruber TaxID=77675 RepID=A0ABS1CQP7_9PROT|nr:hypothetical protein [Paracraurococcus ruber]MBK1656675.1 hypothetical protein [Paracraurococcus ruber]TDG33706.1 hypothetical protein E2C05_02475 [Paracraurococcus ruber]
MLERSFAEIALVDPQWLEAAFAAAAALFLLALVITLVRRRRWQAALEAHVAACCPPRRPYHLPPTIDAAEQEMATLLRRLRAHARDPYDFAASRITSETAFQECLDRAALIGVWIAELGGALPADEAERERTRGLILESVSSRRCIVPRDALPLSV